MAANADRPENIPSEGDNEVIVSEKDTVSLVEDSSIGESIRRRPDLGFSNVTIDGEDSGVSLNSISADAVESVEVMKAVTPELDADSRGGSIVLKSKPAYEQTTTAFFGSIESNYNSLYDKFGYDSNFSMGGPINKAKTWGGRISIRLEDEKREQHNSANNWQSVELDGQVHSVLKSSNLDRYIEEDKTQSISAGLDHKASESLSLYLRGTFSYSDDYNLLPRLEYRLDKDNYVSIDSNGANIQEASLSRRIFQWEGFRDRIETTLGGDYEIDWLEIGFKATYKDSQYEEPDYFTIDFVQDGLDLRYDLDEPAYPVFETTNQMDLNNAEAFAFKDFRSRSRSISESDSIGALNFKLIEPFERKNTYLKFGFKSRAREYDQFLNDPTYDEYNGDFNLSQVLSPIIHPDLLDRRYHYNTFPGYEETNTFFDSNRGDFTLNEGRTRERSDPNSFVVEERVDSAYAMLNLESGKWRSILGLRHEKTNVAFFAHEVVLGQDALGNAVYPGTNSTTGGSAYGHDFPNAHFRYRWNDRLTVIGSLTNTIKRPSYSTVVPYRYVDLEDREISEGNPNLMPTLFTNWDLSFDYGLSPNSLLSVELFDRSVEDFIFSNEGIVPNGIYQGYQLTRSENSSSANIQGLALTLSQPIRLGEFTNGLSLNVKYTSQRSEIEYPTRPGKALSLTELPENSLKLTLNYENERFFAQIKFAQSDDRILSVANDPAEDLFSNPVSDLDLNLNYRVSDKIRLFVDLSNLTNEPSYDRYEGDPSHPALIRYRTWEGATGIKFEL